MKRSGFVEKNHLSLPGGKSTKWLLAILVVFTLMILVVGTALAAFTYSSWTGPAWQTSTPGYRFTIVVTQMSGADHDVCLYYTVATTGTPAPYTTPCTCSSPDCNSSTGLGTWVCRIPTSYPYASVHWEMSSYSNSNCSSMKSAGPTGSFNTGPNAVGLDRLKARSTSGSSFPGAIFLMTGFSAIVFFGSLYRKHKLGKRLTGKSGK